MADGEPPVDDLVERIRAIDVSTFLQTSAVTLASLAYGKLDAGELDETRLAIDALGALVPLLEADARRDFAQTRAHLQLAYAAAVGAAAPPAQ